MKLLETFELGPLSLSNRMVMAPMTRNRATGTVPQPVMQEYYQQRASAGLIVSEGAQVDPFGQGYPNTPGIHSEEQVEAWKKITDAVHEEGGRIFLQLWHVGRISHSSLHGDQPSVAPSAIQPEGETYTADFEMVPFETPRALETEEVLEVVEQFRRGAKYAKAAGFDGVEIHGANGYLIDQFLQSGTNQRTDRYGGSLENRIRFLREVTEAVIDVWGSKRVGVRLAPGGSFNDMYDENTEETFAAAGRALSEYDLAYLHVVENTVNEDDRPASDLMREAYDGTLMVAGGYDRESGEQALKNERADLMAYARFFLANPDLPERFGQDADLNDWDVETFYQGGTDGYIDYPTLEEASVA